MSNRRRPPVNPIVVLVIAALVPALVLWSLWRWTDSRDPDRNDVAPVTTPTVGTTPDAAPALLTPLLSYRRTSAELSRRLNFGEFERQIANFAPSVDDRSCAAVSVDGRPAGGANEDLIVIPASNQKVLVAAVAAEILGDDFRYTTTVAGPAPAEGIVDGDVYLIGGGDPLLSGDWYESSGLDRLGAFNTTSLDELARRVAAAGVREIRGVVRGDGSRYDDEYYVDSWGGGVAGLEAGPYDALLVNDARVRGDDQRSSDPVGAAAREFVRVLGENGVIVSGGSGTGTAPVDLAALATIESEPLSAVIAEMLTNSDNNTAELMVKELGVATSGTGTRRAGLDAIAAQIESWGVPTDGLVLGDGSGLSLDNRISCSTMLGVLQQAGFDSSLGEGLPVAGRTGTLTDIFVDTPVEGRLRGKTGTLNNFPVDQDPPAVKALAGYLPVDGGGAVEYVLILNGPTITDQSEYRSVWAELVTALNSFPAVASPARLGPYR